MADLSSFTPVYSFPYPLAGDSVQNTYARIQALAERIEATYTILGINLDSTAALLQVGDAAGGDLAGSTYPNPIIKNDAITTAKILNRQVTGNKIDEDTITDINLADNAVTTPKLDVVALKDGSTAVTQAQSDNSTRIATTAYVDAYIAGTVPMGSIDTSELADGAVTNAKVNAAAAIAYSKLNLANSIVNADIATSAAISYSKLALSGTIQTTDLAFDVATQVELDNHTNATTSVHGISNTANLVYTNDSRLSDSRTPTGGAGGVLSGTYPNPGFAVDMATQTELDNHASDTTSVHGIADTSVLATQTDVSTAVSTHSSDTTSVHGISDTANLVYTNDARLSDSRTPMGSAGGDLTGSYPNPTLANAGTAGTYTKVTTDAKGRVTSGTTLSESDIPSLSPSKITGTAVITTDARLSDARTPTNHATTHELGGTDEIEVDPTQVTGTAIVEGDARLTDARTPTAHATSHESGGSDELELAPNQITGTAVVDSDSRLTDARTPTSHASTHIPGGSDAIDLTKIIAVGATLPTLPDPLYPAGALFGVGAAAPYLLYRSTGSVWDQIGGAGGGSSVTTDDTAPSTPSDGDLWYDSTTGKTFVWYEDGTSNQWVEVGANAQLTIPQHGVDHVRGGVDVLDGDRLTVDYVPTIYTRNSAASGAGNNTDLTAHLSGIDNKLKYINKYARAKRTSGNLSESTSSWVNVDTGLDLTIQADVGDVIMVAVSGVWQAGGVDKYMDVITVVSGMIVNSFSLDGAPTATGTGISGWVGEATNLTPFGSSFFRALDINDVFNNSVTLRLRRRGPTTATTTLFANSNTPFEWWARNLGPVT